MNKYFFLLIFLIIVSSRVVGQGSLIPYGNPAYHIVDRLSIKTDVQPDLHTSIQPYQRGDVVRYAMKVDTSGSSYFSSSDRMDLYYIFRDNNEWLLCSEYPTTVFGKRESIFSEAFTDSTGTTYYTKSTPLEACEKDARYTETQKPLWNLFYKTPANFFELNHKNFYLRINPQLDFRLAQQLESEDDDPIFLNNRGLEIRGGIDDRLFFYTNIFEIQGQFAQYVRRYRGQFQTHPKAGLVKGYNPSVFPLDNAIDYNWGTAMVGFNVSKHIGIQFGHGSNFIGNGYRSLLLSDFAANYLHLKINWRVGRFHYQNLFAELNATSPNADRFDRRVPRKYMAGHYLSFDLWKGAKFGFFEVTVFNRDEGDQFELQYLNPVILYRSVEQLIGSPDNVLIGANFSQNLFHRFQLYGQIILDEFKASENSGWWANKFGVQAGMKYIDAFGVDHLDLQGEINVVRPYTYTHRDTTGSNYSHNNQALAHPLGANFAEAVFLVQYQPHKKWLVQGRLIGMNYGEDDDLGQNWGGNILTPTGATNIPRVNGNRITQGVDTRTVLAGIDVSYQIWHNLFLDFEYLYRRQDSQLDDRDNTDSYIGGGIRWNINRQRYDF